ncbi:MAG TPA: glycosyltransferase family 4 protein [Ktedonobacterales bacterium]|nr:glycosyltransferase family 4 protein [Ktedonobacterales bacterium]
MKLSRVASLGRKSVEVLRHEGPKTLAWRLNLWSRKHWYFLRGRQAATRKLEVASHAMIATPDPSLPPSSGGREARARDTFRVLFVVPIEEPFSRRYRVDNVRAQLALGGVSSAALYNVDLARRLEYALNFDVIVFHRMPATAELHLFARLARDRGIALAFDVDDYIYEPAMLWRVPVLESATPAERDQLTRQVESCREMLGVCENFIGSTRFLADRARDLGRRAFVIRNGLSARQLALAEAALARRARVRRDRERETVRVGYLSGTRTHAKDFSVVLPALRRLLDECPQMTLVIRGLLDIPSELLPYGSRIERQPYVSWERLVGATAELDVTIAPLDMDNPFTEGKSALKYFESANVAVPVVASSTEEFRASIRQGENGFLATSAEDWHRSLRGLIMDHDLRERMGRDARLDALARYTPAAQSEATVEVFQAVVARHAAVMERA